MRTIMMMPVSADTQDRRREHNIRTCWPRQIRGPALKGRKMYGFGVTYLCRRSSRKRSGSNSSADTEIVNSRALSSNINTTLGKIHTIRTPQIFPPVHQEHRICNTVTGQYKRDLAMHRNSTRLTRSLVVYTRAPRRKQGWQELWHL